MCWTRVAVYVEYLSHGPRCLFPMFEVLRYLFYISILHIFPLHEDYGQDGADDDEVNISMVGIDKVKVSTFSLSLAHVSHFFQNESRGPTSNRRVLHFCNF